jgi:hypothetical protein
MPLEIKVVEENSSPTTFNPPKIYSISQLDCYISCPAKYKYRYIERIPSPTSASLEFGNSVHRGLEHNFHQKTFSWADLSANEVSDKFVESYEPSKDKINWDEENRDKTDKDKISFVSERDKGVALLRTYMNDGYTKTIIPSRVEHKFEVPVPGVSKPLQGYIDLVDNKLLLIDFKTASKSPTEAKLGPYHRQLCGYSYALLKLKQMRHDLSEVEINALNKMPFFKARLDFLIKTKTPKIVIVDTFKIGLEEIKRFVSMLQEMDKSINANLFPRNSTSYLCNKKYCNYWDKCHNDQIENIDLEVDKSGRLFRKPKS